ncbi:hypothetical protein EG329_001200 [Mollisiaceae sp. DMI_Dod_QoI]|nr:hypothetical protein EG329_001200 [Helotiales sp. DMI_Dod_QoI]
MGSSASYAAESERLWLQPLSEDHLHDYHAIQSNKYCMMWSAWAPDTTLQQTLDRIHENQPTLEEPWNQRWAILLRSSESDKGTKPKMIGIIGIVRVQEVGYKLHPDFWGKGYMSEALRMMLAMFWATEGKAFHPLCSVQTCQCLRENKKYNDIFAYADPENTASLRVLEKAGFQKGVLVKNRYSRALRLPMKDLQQSREWLQQSLSSVNPNIDKFGIILKPEFDTQTFGEDGKEKSGEAREAKQPTMVGICGTIGDGTEMVYMLRHEWWRKGYMTEALNAFAGPDGVFWKFPNRKHIKTLCAHIDAENFPSMKTISKIGGRGVEKKVKCYSLARDRGGDGTVPEEKLRDMIYWYVDRPK